MARRRTATVDPPAAAPGGVSGNRAPVATGQETGRLPGFSIPSATAWDAICGQPEVVTDLTDFINELADNNELRGAAFVRAFDRFRDELDRIPEHSDLSSPVVLKLQDAVVLARWMLARFR